MVRSNPSQRLEPHPTQTLDRSTQSAFDFNGRSVHAYHGDTVASALYASGVRIFSRSFKYHRARGLLCVAGRCPNCLMTVDGVPNVRACTEPVRDGMSVRHQNAWPSVDHDVLSILDRFERLMPVGFYYKTFHRPRLFWRMVAPVVRRVAGLGSVDTDAVSESRYIHEHRHTEVAVVGGGPAGMEAALAASSSGARVVLVDDQPHLGGHLRMDLRQYRDLPGLAESAGFELARTLSDSVLSEPRIEVLSPASAFGLYEGNLLAILWGNRMVKLRARRVVVATGSHEAPITFDRNDLPGVMLSTGVQRLIHTYGLRPGSTAVVATSNDHGYYAALDLVRAGIRVAALTDSRPGFPSRLDAARELQSMGVLVLASHVPIRAEGVKRVVGAAVTRLSDGRHTTEEREFDCDLIALSGGFQGASSLLRQAGASLGYDAGLDEVVPRELPPDVMAAGEVTGLRDTRLSLLQGRQAGLQAASNVGGGPSGQKALANELQALEQEYRSSATHLPPPVASQRGAKQFVCFCEDVTAKDITQAVEEGFEDIQTSKRYTTVSMGPCQGAMCLKRYVLLNAQRMGKSFDQLGLTTARPPVVPVPLGALAGPSHLPIKLTSIDRKHRELGAQMIDSGPWHRPYGYGSPQEECRAVRERVGIIDVGTLGKLDVRGRDAPELLDKVYTHHYSNLRVGRVRYGVLCMDNGTVMDDGTVTRLAEDHFFVTTSTANIDLVEEWFKWWMAGTGMCAHVVNVTSGYAAINVAGPSARDTLRKLTDVDLSPEGFRYMRSAQGDVAGVPCLFLRIGFVGETGWELHFPAEYGEYMWDTLMASGEEFGVSPFGVEAQRILRLEKAHIIPAQDTDLLSTPFESGMDWVVRFDKEDFIGRAGLLATRERGLPLRLVGFVMGDQLVPDDGDPVLANGYPVGRVTSSRLSPTLGKGFGLALVPTELAEDGGRIWIRVDGRDVPAEVTLQPVYDPDGKRLRE